MVITPMLAPVGRYIECDNAYPALAYVRPPTAYRCVAELTAQICAVLTVSTHGCGWFLHSLYLRIVLL